MGDANTYLKIIERIDALLISAFIVGVNLEVANTEFSMEMLGYTNGMVNGQLLFVFISIISVWRAVAALFVQLLRRSGLYLFGLIF